MTTSAKLRESRPLRRVLVVAVVVLLAASRASAQERDEWSLRCIGKDRVGYEHEQVTVVHRDGRALWRFSHDEHLILKRLGQSLRVDVTVWMLEDEAGQ